MKSIVGIVALIFSASTLALTITSHKTAGLEFPENSIEGFKHSLHLPIDYIELDLHLTKDKVYVLGHDPVFDNQNCFTKNTNNAVVIKHTSFSELKELSCYNQKVQKHFNISSLDEILNHYTREDSDIALNLELKVLDKLIENNPRYDGLDKSQFHFSNKEQAKAILKILRKHDITEKIVLSSFSRELLLEIKKLKRDYEFFKFALLYKGEYSPAKLGLLVKLLGKTCFDNCWWPKWRETKKWLVKNKIDYFMPNWKLLTHPLFNFTFKRAFQSRPKPFAMIPWTLNKEEDWQEFESYYFEGIITDRPSLFITR